MGERGTDKASVRQLMNDERSDGRVKIMSILTSCMKKCSRMMVADRIA